MQIALLAPVLTTWLSYWLFFPLSSLAPTLSSIGDTSPTEVKCLLLWVWCVVGVVWPSSIVGVMCSDQVFKQGTLEEEYSQIFIIHTHTHTYTHNSFLPCPILPYYHLYLYRMMASCPPIIGKALSTLLGKQKWTFRIPNLVLSVTLIGSTKAHKLTAI